MRKDVLNLIDMIGGDEELINKSALARRFNCDRKTIDNYLESSKKPRKSRKYISKLDPFKGIIIDKVDNYSATAKAVFRFIKTKGYDGKYGIVRKYIEEHVKEEKNKATLRFETSPGLQAQVDWKEDFKLTNRSGQKFQFNVFLIVLGYSRFKYFEVTSDRNQDTLFKCMINAFKHFNGMVPKEILFDNMSTVVDRSASTFRTVIINKRFSDFAKEMGFTVLTCRPYRPQTKGKIEAIAKIIDNLVPYNDEFDTYEDIESIVRDLNYMFNNEKSNFLEDTPEELLKKETEYMNPMPVYEAISHYFSKPKEYKVSKESMVSYKGKKYSVPIRFIGKYTNIIEDEDTIQINYNTDCIATHRISDVLLNYNREHYIEILKSNAFKSKTDFEINEIINKNLESMDRLLISNEEERYSDKLQ